MLWCFAVLRGSLLGSSVNSQVFMSSNGLKMRRFFFFCEEKISNLSKYKVIGALRVWDPVDSQGRVGICIPLEDGTKLLRLLENFTLKLRATTCLFSAKQQRFSPPLGQYVPEGDVNFLHQNVVPDEQGLLTTYVSGGSNRSFNICLCKQETRLVTTVKIHVCVQGMQPRDVNFMWVKKTTSTCT